LAIDDGLVRNITSKKRRLRGSPDLLPSSDDGDGDGEYLREGPCYSAEQQFGCCRE
jgi:hypothetical protein